MGVRRRSPRENLHFCRFLGLVGAWGCCFRTLRTGIYRWVHFQRDPGCPSKDPTINWFLMGRVHFWTPCFPHFPDPDSPLSDYVHQASAPHLTPTSTTHQNDPHHTCPKTVQMCPTPRVMVFGGKLVILVPLRQPILPSTTPHPDILFLVPSNLTHTATQPHPQPRASVACWLFAARRLQKFVIFSWKW